ncbi:plasmid pRiA4b ORF-3 family protein [Chryseobacterium fistulae]|nr:plasmid pRiA4b ORF-3 family protein [Chryseobacterium fistulae]
MIEENLIQIKIHILGISPQISRRFVVSDNTSIAQFHHLLQMIMGWDGYFLHEFHILGRYYGSSYSNDCNAPLSHFDFKEKDKFTYTYNFYDFWEHELRVEKIIPLPAHYHYPKVIAGKRACPIEGIGGAKYYEEAITRQLLWCYDMLEEVAESIEDKKFPDIDFEEVPSWYLHHNSERFDKNRINKALKKLYQKNGNPDFWYTLGDYSELFED